MELDDNVAVQLEYLKSKMAKPKRTKPNVNVDPDFAEKINQNYNVLPLYESRIYNYVYLKHYSLETNEFLKHQLDVYKNQRARGPRVPFQFVDSRDFHFHNCNIKYKPDESNFRHTNVPYKLHLGPAIDNVGQIPLPDELLYKRYDITNRKYPKKYGQKLGKDGKSKNYPEETNLEMTSNIKNNKISERPVYLQPWRP